MGSSTSKSNSGNGNINYSLNKNDLYVILTGSIGFLLFYYYAVLIISFIYLSTLKITQYKYIDNLGRETELPKVINFFDSLTVNSPFNILSKKTFQLNIDENSFNYMGLSTHSYLLIISVFVASFLVILNGLLRNYIYSVLGNIIQVNPNNNPYDNPACIKKTDENPNLKVLANYTSIATLSVFFFLPFLVSYVSNIFGFDNYDIKKSYWFNYVVLIIIISPFLLIFGLGTAISEKLNIFPNLLRLIDEKDYPYVNYITSSFDLKFSTFSVFLFVLFVFAYLVYMYIDFQIQGFKYKALVYFLLFLLLFVFIPIFLLFFCYLNIFSSIRPASDINNPPTNAEEAGKNEIDSINKDGVSSLYQLLVKYNYPCFLKSN
jgi:hypothetical protein